MMRIRTQCKSNTEVGAFLLSLGAARRASFVRYLLANCTFPTILKLDTVERSANYQKTSLLLKITVDLNSTHKCYDQLALFPTSIRSLIVAQVLDNFGFQVKPQERLISRNQGESATSDSQQHIEPVVMDTDDQSLSLVDDFFAKLLV